MSIQSIGKIWNSLGRVGFFRNIMKKANGQYNAGLYNEASVGFPSYYYEQSQPRHSIQAIGKIRNSLGRVGFFRNIMKKAERSNTIVVICLCCGGFFS